MGSKGKNQSFKIEYNENEATKNAIAVVGMSCRFPGANSADEYWDFLCSGQSGITNFPKNRPISPDEADEFIKMRGGFLACPVDEFDANFFGISPREAPYMDPQQRIFLEVTWEALESGGINPQLLKNTNTGVFLGIWQQDYKSLLPDSDFIHRYLGNDFSASASRISYCLGLYGPAIAIESGCSSSLTALHLACESLKKGEISVAVSGGVNLILNTSGPFSGKNQSSAVLSKNYLCKTFDESADGFVRAEGCGVIIIKRIEDAIENNDNILAIIRGSSINNDGHGTSFGTPNAKAQIRVFQEALNNARVEAKSIKYIEAHGTGTIVGDPIETYAIGQIYSRGRLQEDPLILSSVKTSIGHCESAAGIASLIKMILCLKKSLIPPHLNFNKLNTKIDLKSIPAIIPMKLTPWVGKNKLGAVSSFSMSGTNVHVIVQEAPFKAFEISENSIQLVTLSAKSNEALDTLCDRYIKLLQENENENISINNIAYTANTGRANLSHRVGIMAQDKKSFIKNITEKNFCSSGIATNKEMEIGFLFTGQGSQYFGMGKKLYKSSMVFRESLDEIDAMFLPKLKISIKNILWENDKLLEQSLYCQPAIFCLEVALYKTWISFGIFPKFVLGHSFGEFAAAVCSGFLGLNDAIKLVFARSELVNSLGHGAMLVIQYSEDEALQIVKDFNLNYKYLIDIASINSPQEIVVSGSLDSIENFEKICGGKCSRVSTMSAFHSSMMDKITMDFGKVANVVTINDPICGYISGTTAKLMKKSDFNTFYWTQHLRNTVKFSEAVKILNNNCEFLVEIGPQPNLLGLALRNLDTNSKQKCCCPSIKKNEDDIQCFLKSLAKLYTAGADVKWNKWFSTPVKKVKLPFYPFERQRYWIDSNKNRNMMLLKTPQVHLLLGREFYSPINDTVFFQNICKNKIRWLEDHKIADKIIIPAAVFLEIFLAAARQILNSNFKFIITIENFIVKSALQFTNEVNIQTIMTQIDHSKMLYRLSINHQHDSLIDKWTQHAVANFSTSLLFSDFENIDLDLLQSKLILIKDISSVYVELNKLGYQFGISFQSIKSAWIGNNEILTRLELPGDSEAFICHPIVLDAIIQTSAIRIYLNSNFDNQRIIYLPVSIGKFTWLSEQCTSVMYIYSSENSSKLSLYSESGIVLGVIEGLELIKTTVDSFSRTLNSTESFYIPFMTEEWVEDIKVSNYDFQLNKLITSDGFGPNTKEIYKTEMYKNNDEIFLKTCNLGFLYLIRAIIQLNWEWPEIGAVLESKKWKSQLLSSAVNPLVIDSYMSQLLSESYLRHDSEANKYRVIKNLPNMAQVDAQIYELSQELRFSSIVDETSIKFTENIGMNLPDILRGKKTSFAVLFPEDENKVGAIKFYTESKWYLLMTEISLAIFYDTIPANIGVIEKLRILEVGAGSGSSSLQLISKLRELGIEFEFTYSDITPFFYEKVKKKLGDGVKYRVLNIEEDPLSQGFAPEQFDLIIAMQVIHSTRNIEESLSNLNNLLKIGGRLIISEFFKMRQVYEIPFSLLESWWRFQDFRIKNPCLSITKWKKSLNSTGFSSIVTNVISDGAVGGILSIKSEKCLFTQTNKFWIIFTDNSDLSNNIKNKLEKNARNVLEVEINKNKNDIIVINEKRCEDFSIFFKNNIHYIEGVIYFWTNSNAISSIVTEQNFHAATIFYMLKTYQEHEPIISNPMKVVLVTRGVSYIDDDICVFPNGATGWGLFKTFTNETLKSRGQLIDMSPYPTEFETNQVFNELWNVDSESFISFRENKRFFQRLVTLRDDNNELILSNTDRYKIIIPKSGSFSDMNIGPAYKLPLMNDEVEILIKATSLNFHDLFSVLRPKGFIVPNEEERPLGVDISGIVVRVGPNSKNFKKGDAVYGYSFKGGCASHVVDSEKAFVHKPEIFTFAQASTIPIAYLTAYVCLINVAKVNKNDKVLVHVASGGVGLAAIQILKNVGAQIFTTAGSNRKRNYLNSLGIQYIYNSRNTSYGEDILRDTSGSGISVVINSLTGSNFKETTIGVCAKNARFIEIAKVNIWTKEDVKNLRPDIKYDIVDLTRKDTLDENRKLLQDIGKNINDGLYEPLPSVLFPLTHIKDAFYHFQKAKHIGKITILMPDHKYENGKLEIKNNIFNSYSTYLITGGLGGLGIEVTKWMISSGAKFIVLAGRNRPSETNIDVINSLNEKGGNIIIINTDIGVKENCIFLLNEIQIKKLPPLRGIIHAAGIIKDNFIFKQNWKNIEEVLKPKVYGGWYLHELTLKYQLEFFIMFSSMSSITGMLSQCNHVAANRYIDSLTFLRDSLGLPATTINWGAWSEIGAAAKIKEGQGLSLFTPEQGIAYLSKIMLLHKEKQISVLSISDWSSVKRVFPGLGNYLENIKSNENTVSIHADLDIEKLVIDINEAPQHKKQDKIEIFIENLVRQTLKISKSTIPNDQNFIELGLDSLMSMEIKNRIQQILGDKILNINSIQENPTVRSLSSHIAQLLEPHVANNKIFEKCHTNDISLLNDLKPVQYIKKKDFNHVLLTGVTGHLGIHTLKELLSQNKFLKVTCIIRCRQENTAIERLSQILDYYKLSVDLNRIIAIKGDTRLFNLGLEQSYYQNLAIEVDAVFHCAALSNHIFPYSDGTTNDIRTHNVVGLTNVVKFALGRKVKLLFHASSILAVTKLDTNRNLNEDWPSDAEEGDEIECGYTLSKFVGEKLLKKAESKGLPVICLRYPGLLGDSNNGIMPSGFDHAWNFFLACMRVRLFPQFILKTLPIIHVDNAAKISVKLFLSPNVEMGVYNLGPQSVLSNEEINEIFSPFGMKMRCVPFNEWRDVVFDKNPSTDLGPIAFLYKNNGGIPEVLKISPLYSLSQNYNLELEPSEKLLRNVKDFQEALIPPKEVLKKHLECHFHTFKQ